MQKFSHTLNGFEQHTGVESPEAYFKHYDSISLVYPGINLTAVNACYCYLLRITL